MWRCKKIRARGWPEAIALIREALLIGASVPPRVVSSSVARALLDSAPHHVLRLAPRVRCKEFFAEANGTPGDRQGRHRCVT